LKIQYSGTPAGVLKGGFMLKHIPNIKIKTNIANLPERVVVDVSKINIGETLSVKDLNLGKDVEILTDANLPIVSVSPAR
jgi:large subunit ribosomal protein L25